MKNMALTPYRRESILLHPSYWHACQTVSLQPSIWSNCFNLHPKRSFIKTTPCKLFMGITALDTLVMHVIVTSPTCRLVQLARDRLKYLFSLSEYYIEKDECELAAGQRFPTLLLDLANYHDNELIQESLHLLNRFYSAEMTLFQKAIQTELILTEESHTVHSQVVHMELPIIRRLVRVCL